MKESYQWFIKDTGRVVVELSATSTIHPYVVIAVDEAIEQLYGEKIFQKKCLRPDDQTVNALGL